MLYSDHPLVDGPVGDRLKLDAVLLVEDHALYRVGELVRGHAVADHIADGDLARKALPSALGADEQSVLAARLVMAGVDAAGESLYFFNPALSQGKWVRANRTYHMTIGCHRFYK